MVGEEIGSFCLGILNGEGEMRPINRTHIVLIPKGKDPKTMKEFGPISLCSVLYKIIAKTLANRLKGVLNDIISPS